ncbi:MAG: ATP-binding protein [Lachnospiraceae bacterium]|nr:ATP-binding protein [Lachnospiraceae bacterium]
MIGRKEEIEELNEKYNSTKAELIAIYGRRRVGKTYLVDEVFRDRITFKHAGLSPSAENKKGVLKAQLDHFYNSLIMQGMEEGDKPKSWMEVFFLLEKHLQRIDDGGRQLVFIDELPWLDTPRSNFIMAFEGFWNNWGCHRRNLMVIVCGSSNSWILDHLINNHGGLYNRVTYQIYLMPFSLKECEEYYKENKIRFSRYDIVQSYMVFGGIPYYMEYMKNKLSFAQNVDNVFFSKKAVLRDEFHRLFDSVFDKPEQEKAIVRFLYSKNAGYTRKEIIDKLHMPPGGHLTTYLNALMNGNFVMKYVPFGLSKKEEHYKLIDPFCLFYLHFVEGQNKFDSMKWEQITNTQQVISWRGFAFENVCFHHVEQIKKSLGISGVSTSTSVWSKKRDDKEGAQIDLLIIRKDNVINMCECKFYSDIFTVEESYFRKVLRRSEMLLEKASPKTSVYSTLITTFGLKHNEYRDAFINVVTLDDLFA